MKHLIIGLVIALLGISMTHAAVFQPSVTIDAQRASSYSVTIDTFLEKYVSTKTESFLQDRFLKVDGKVTQLLKNTALPERIVFILEYIQYWINDWLDDTDDENNDVSGESPSDQDRTINVSDYQEGAKTIVAGQESGPIVRFELTANLEKIQIDKLSIISTLNSFGESIEYVRIYDKNGKLVATDRPSGNTATFNNANLIIDNGGSNYFYITLQPYGIGQGIENPQTSTFTLKRRTDESVGVTSNKKLPMSTKSNTIDEITIAPIAISSIEILPSYLGYYADSNFYNNVKADLAIVAINITESDNIDTSSSQNLKTLLQEFTIKIMDGTVAGNITDTIEIQRIDTLSEKVTGTVDGDLVSFDLTQFGNDKHIVDQGKKVVLLITATPTLHSVQKESVTIELDNANAAILTYKTTDASSPMLSTISMQPQFIGTVRISD